MARLVAPSQRTSHQGPSRPAAARAPRHREPLLPHASVGDPPALAGGSGSVSCVVTAPFPWVLFPPGWASPVSKPHWPPKSDSLEIPSPFSGAPGWEAWRGAQNLYSIGRTSLVLPLSVCGLATRRVWDLIFNTIVPLLPSLLPLLLCLWMWGISFGGSSVPPSVVVQQLLRLCCSCRRWAHILYSAILNLKPQFFKICLFSVWCDTSDVSLSIYVHVYVTRNI